MREDKLAERLRVLRAKRGLGLVEAANQIGVERHTLRDLERGERPNVRYATLEKIAQAYDVAVEALLMPERPLSEELALSGKGEAPEEAGLDDDVGDPVKFLSSLRQQALDVHEELQQRFAELREGAGAVEKLPTLFAEVSLVRVGVITILTNEDLLRVLLEKGQSSGAEEEVHLAIERAGRVLARLDDLADDISDASEEPVSDAVVKAHRMWGMAS